MSYRLGVDVGGTFTDLLLVNESTGGIWSAKVPSTPADQSIGVLNGIVRVCERAGIAPREIDHVMHGTTVATNTVLTGTGARCGLLVGRKVSNLYVYICRFVLMSRLVNMVLTERRDGYRK